MRKIFTHNSIEPTRFLGEATKVLSYDRDTGAFSWLVTLRDDDPAPRRAGRTAKTGYVGIQLFGETFFAHRLAWLYVHGVWPTAYIDHINGDKGDNRISNLRNVSQSENNCNRARPRRDNPGLPMGVTKITGKRAVKYRAKIKLGDRQVHLGTYSNPTDAGRAFDAAVRANRSNLAATNERLGLL